jgi:hypothetical protein
MSDESNSSNRLPGTFENVPTQFHRPFDAVRPDMPAENFFIANQGIHFFHYQCVSDPLYQVNSGDARHSFDQEENQQFEDTDRFHRENGLIYFKKGVVLGIFQGNHKDSKRLTSGLYTSAGASMTLNRYYIDTTDKIEVCENDKLIPCEMPCEFFTTITHKFDHNPTGIDRLQFKAVNVSHLIDSAGIIYVQDEDFTLVCGCINWINGRNRPGIDPLSGKGRVCGIRYTYKPFYYLAQILHDIRIKPAMDPVTGAISAVAGPVLVQAVADWVYLDRRTANSNAADAQLHAGDGSNTGPR